MYQLTVRHQAWPTSDKTSTTRVPCLMALRKHVRDWREFARYEDNHVFEMRVTELDLAHEADMAALRKEQLRADIDVEEANAEAELQAALDADYFGDDF